MRADLKAARKYLQLFRADGPSAFYGVVLIALRLAGHAKCEVIGTSLSELRELREAALKREAEAEGHYRVVGVSQSNKVNGPATLSIDIPSHNRGSQFGNSSGDPV